MTKEAEDQVGASAQASKAASDQRLDFVRGQRRSILEPALDIAMAVFFRIKFGRVGRQPLNTDPWLACKIGSNASVTMDGGPVPNEDPGLGQVTRKVFERRNNSQRIERTRNVLLVDLAGQG